MSGKKAKLARRNNPNQTVNKRMCPTRVDSGQIWKSGTFVPGTRVIEDLKKIAKVKTRVTYSPAMDEVTAVVAALNDHSYRSKLNDDTRELISRSAASSGLSEEGILAELEARNIFPPGMSKEDWLQQGYAGTWANEREAVRGLLRDDLSYVVTDEALQEAYDRVKEVSPLNITSLDDGRVVVSSVLPNNLSGRLALKGYYETGKMPDYMIP